MKGFLTEFFVVVDSEVAKCLAHKISSLLNKAWMTVLQEMVDGTNHRFEFANCTGGFVNYSRDCVHGFKRSFDGREDILGVDKVVSADVIHVGGSSKFLLARRVGDWKASDVV